MRAIEFKQEAVRRVASGETTAAELSRELGIHPSLLQYCKRRITGGAHVAITANEDVVPASEFKSAQQRIAGFGARSCMMQTISTAALA